jgi:hypothetical protein
MERETTACPWIHSSESETLILSVDSEWPLLINSIVLRKINIMSWFDEYLITLYQLRYGRLTWVNGRLDAWTSAMASPRSGRPCGWEERRSSWACFPSRPPVTTSPGPATHRVQCHTAPEHRRAGAGDTHSAHLSRALVPHTAPEHRRTGAGDTSKRHLLHSDFSVTQHLNTGGRVLGTPTAHTSFGLQCHTQRLNTGGRVLGTPTAHTSFGLQCHTQHLNTGGWVLGAPANGTYVILTSASHSTWTQEGGCWGHPQRTSHSGFSATHSTWTQEGGCWGHQQRIRHMRHNTWYCWDI